MAHLKSAILLGCFVWTCTAQAADWPQWRGPNRDGIAPETGLIKQWPEAGPALLWESRGFGRGYSSVSIVGKTLFTMGDLQEDGDTSQYIIAFDIDARRPLWKAKVGPRHSDGSRCTPTVFDGLVYAVGTDGDLVCVQAASGNEVWRKSFSRDFGGRMMSGWKYSESPLIDGDKVICTPGGRDAALAAFNRKTGQIIWTCKPAQDMGGAGYASCVVSEGAGVRQYVTVMGRGVISADAATGKFLWAYPRVANGTANICTPVVRGDHVFVSTGYNTGSALLKLSKKDDGVAAEQVYWLNANTFQSHHGGFVLIGDFLYGSHGHNAGNPICIEFLTGKVIWGQRQLGKGSGALLAADGRLYYRYEDNIISQVEVNPEKYVLAGQMKVPGRPQMGGPGWAHPVILDGRMYLRHNDYLFCYDVKAR